MTVSSVLSTRPSINQSNNDCKQASRIYLQQNNTIGREMRHYMYRIRLKECRSRVNQIGCLHSCECWLLLGCAIRVTRDLDLWPFDPIINGFEALVVEHLYVKFGDPRLLATSSFETSCAKYRQTNRQTDRQTNGGENRTHATDSATRGRLSQTHVVKILRTQTNSETAVRSS